MAHLFLEKVSKKKSRVCDCERDCFKNRGLFQSLLSICCHKIEGQYVSTRPEFWSRSASIRESLNDLRASLTIRKEGRGRYGLSDECAQSIEERKGKICRGGFVPKRFN